MLPLLTGTIYYPRLNNSCIAVENPTERKANEMDGSEIRDREGRVLEILGKSTDY